MYKIYVWCLLLQFLNGEKRKKPSDFQKFQFYTFDQIKTYLKQMREKSLFREEFRISLFGTPNEFSQWIHRSLLF